MRPAAGIFTRTAGAMLPCADSKPLALRPYAVVGRGCLGKPYGRPCNNTCSQSPSHGVTGNVSVRPEYHRHALFRRNQSVGRCLNSRSNGASSTLFNAPRAASQRPSARGRVYPRPRIFEGPLQRMRLEYVWRDLPGPYSSHRTNA